MIYIDKEIGCLTERLEGITDFDNIKETSTEQTRSHTEDVEKFLALENITNGDLRKIISRITVNRKGEIKVYLRNFSDLMIE